MKNKFVPGDHVLVRNELSSKLEKMTIANEGNCKFFSSKICRGYCNIGVRLIDENGNSDCFPMWEILMVLK